MQPTVPVEQNPLIQNSFLGSKYLNPAYLFNHLYDFFYHLFHFFHDNASQLSSLLNGLLVFFTIFFLAIIAYVAVRMFEIRKKEHAHTHHEMAEYAHNHAEREKKAQAGEGSKNEHWVQVLNNLFSASAGEWKLAIIEADSMLEDLLDQLGFKGESLGDKLKNADPEKFRSLPIAWEVHTIRNRIAHEGSNFNLSQHEAKRVIALYEQIFRQYGFI